MWSGVPVQHSEYVELAMDQLIQPVINAASRLLQSDAQLMTVSTAVTALCEAWSSNILARKIRFRFQH